MQQNSPSAGSPTGGLHAWLHAPVPQSGLQARAQKLHAALWLLLRNPSGLIGALIVLLLILIAAFAPLIAPHDIYEQNLAGRLARPSAEHLLGTDELGRDILSRTIYGARITLRITFLTVLIAGPIGVIIGTIIIAVIASLVSSKATQTKIDARLEEDSRKSLSDAE